MSATPILRLTVNNNLSSTRHLGTITGSEKDDNMLTKYPTSKFIDFCKVWILPESEARVAAIVGDHRCHTSRH
ncbi:hypothetical protein TNCV_4950551 [Trichonephila clavipes]|nr:hypothetical protein TNCV_4950551 [Trichonephila clavipes]